MSKNSGSVLLKIIMIFNAKAQVGTLFFIKIKKK